MSDEATWPRFRDVESGLDCPRCGLPLRVRQLCVSRADAPTEQWVATQRYCPGGCALLGDEVASHMPVVDPYIDPGT